MSNICKPLIFAGLLASGMFGSAQAQDSASAQNCDQPHKDAWFRAACKRELGRLTASQLAGDWIVVRATRFELDTATSLAAFDAAWRGWEPLWEASHVDPKNAKDRYFSDAFGARAYEVLNAARNNEVERIVSRGNASRKNQSFAESDSTLLTSRCFNQLEFALNAKDSDFAVRLALSHAKECTAQLYSELRAARQ